ncbi:histidine kinase [Neolewinella persica]|uniref:histidine kinase n=1 Tax=Neolewinella persica TaxID=70998 RepID=UPI000365E37D|nr:histidine kinase [Neolewinella persica]
MKHCWLMLFAFFWCGCSFALPPETFRVDILKFEHQLVGAPDWETGPPRSVGHFQLRIEVEVNGKPVAYKPYGLLISMLASSEAYWDGNSLGANGSVGQSADTEIPGQLDYVYYLPDSLLAPGKHLLNLEVSNFHADGKVRFYGILVAGYLDPIVKPIITAAYLHIYAGCFLIIGLYFGFRFVTNRKDFSLLVFAATCLSFFALLIMEYIRSYYFYPYPWHFPRLWTILILSYLISACLPIFFSIRFRFRWLYLVVIAQLGLFVLLLTFNTYGLDPTTNFGMILGFVLASGICLWAVLTRQKGARLAFFGVLPVTIALIVGYKNYDMVLYAGFSYLVLTSMGSLAIKERNDRQEREEALLLSSRLRLELLQKSIQPHFLMNSIASAIDWIEEHPPKGVELLLSLSEEFDLLLEVSERQLIPMEQELALCRAHLKVMGFRKLQQYELITENCDPADHIPPAIILTLIENGISHHSGVVLEGSNVIFRLRQESTDFGKLFRFLAVDEQGVPTAENIVKGTGLRYVEARLKESYGNNWSLNSRPVLEGWETTIRIT